MIKFISSAVVLGCITVVCSLCVAATVQNSAVVLTGEDLSRVIPSGFYFQGLSAPTQTRNSAAGRLAKDRNVIAGLVDTSGYSSGIREKYQGFFITDSPVSIDGKAVEVGAYGFGFTNDGKFNLLDLSGKDVISAAATRDNDLRRPRPLMMAVNGGRLRLYSGRDYVEITAR